MNINISRIDPKVTLQYHSEDVGKIIKETTQICRNKNIKKSEEEVFNMLYDSGHLSVFEHVSFTFLVENISRACSHQLVRFRIGTSFTQRSQRTCKENSFVLPPSIHAFDVSRQWATDAIENTMQYYNDALQSDIPMEDARYLLPNATTTSLVMTMNGRQLIHAGKLRLCMHAQEEIRMLFEEVQRLVSGVFRPLAIAMQPDCDTCMHKSRLCSK